MKDMKQIKEANYSQNSGKLETFLQNYGNFLGDCSNHTGDLDSLIKDFTASIPPPPQQSTDNQMIQQIYRKGLNLTKQSSSDLVTKLRSLKEQKLQELIVYTEQLNTTLNSQYEKEIARAIEMGIYSKAHQN